MKTALNTGKNPVAQLNEFRVQPMQILDFGRHTIRVNMNSTEGWWRSNVDRTEGDLEFVKGVCVSRDLPQPVEIALHRAGLK